MTQQERVQAQCDALNAQIRGARRAAVQRRMLKTKVVGWFLIGAVCVVCAPLVLLPTPQPNWLLNSPVFPVGLLIGLIYCITDSHLDKLDEEYKADSEDAWDREYYRRRVAERVR